MGWLWLLALSCSEPEVSVVPPAATTTARPTPTTSTLTLRVPVRSSTTRHPFKESDPGITQAITVLGAVVDAHATDPDNPWAIGHGLLARGSGLKLTNGIPAVDHLFERYAEPFDASPDTLLRFPDQLGTIRIEPHTDLLLKALTEAGVAPSRTVTVQGKAHTVEALYRGSLVSTWLVAARDHSSFSSPNDIPWSLQALSAWAEPGLAWTARDGTPMSLDTLTQFTATILEQETRFLAEAMASNGSFQKKGQGIFKYTCGGAHLMQGVAHAVARGFGGSKARQVIGDQATLLVWRLPRELAQIDAGAEEHLQYALRLHVQRLKLTGHTLETLHKLSATGLLPDGMGDALPSIAAEVVRSVATLDQRGVFARLDEIRAKDEQLYLDIVGDSAHALRGLTLATGQSGVYVD